MKQFEHPNMGNDWKCPICNTNEDKPIVLMGVDGTEDGNIEEAEQIHLDCINLRLNKQYRLIYQKYG